MLVRLKKSEISIAEQAARLRWQLARASGVPNRKVDFDRTDQEIDLLGIKAEIAVSKVLQIDFNASALGIDSGGDMFVDVGDRELSIQIKSTFTADGNLLFTKRERFGWDVAVLVCATDQHDVLDVVGCISKAKAQDVALCRDLGKGEGLFIARGELSRIAALLELIASKRVYK
jgi:hypothetical protein